LCGFEEESYGKADCELTASFCFITLALHHYQLKYSYGKSNKKQQIRDSINKKVRLFQTELLLIYR